MSQSEPPHLIVVIFSWCPRGGVGSRRWSKFAKYLSKRGLRTFVHTMQYPYREPINWCHDVENNPLITSRATPLGYPTYLLQPSRNFLIKLGSRILGRTTHRLDAAQVWAGRVAAELADRIVPGCPVVLTVPPFSLLLAAPLLRDRYPDNPIVLDFRDPWRYYLPERGEKKGKEADRIARKAINAADSVWATTPEHRAGLISRYEIDPDKVVVIPNGYDPEDYEGFPAANYNNFLAAYIGFLNVARLQQLADFLEVVERQGSKKLQREFGIDLYTANLMPLQKLPAHQRELIQKYVTMQPPVPPSRIPEILNQHRFGLTLEQAEYNDIIPVKNFEYLALERQIISLGPVNSFHERLRGAGHLVAPVEAAAMGEIVAKLSELVEHQTTPQNKNDRFPDFSVKQISQSVEDVLLTIGRQPI